MKALETELAGLQREVWLAIRHWPELLGPSIAELAAHLGRKEGSICGRINELRAAGAVVDGPLKPGRCGVQVKSYTAMVWREPVYEQAQGVLW